MVTYPQVIEHFKSVQAAADFFKINASAVYQWQTRRRQAIPRERELELNLRLPQKFPPQVSAA